jgi:hypothetical protein
MTAESIQDVSSEKVDIDRDVWADTKDSPVQWVEMHLQRLLTRRTLERIYITGEAIR